MNSFIPWVGGKKLLRKYIIEHFPQEFNRYIEVFGGAAWVLFYKERLAEYEIYNDLNSELVNLFKCVKYHSNAVNEELNLLLNSREIFEDFKKYEGLTDIQRAVRYYYLIKMSYGAKAKTYGGFNRCIKNVDLTKVFQRLSKVVIENRSFEELIPFYDKSDTLFYCDPPYYGTENMYDIKFKKEQHMLLNDILKSVKGKFILSYNDDDFIRDLYKDFNVTKIQRTNSLSSQSNSYFDELIIKNY